MCIQSVLVVMGMATHFRALVELLAPSGGKIKLHTLEWYTAAHWTVHCRTLEWYTAAHEG